MAHNATVHERLYHLRSFLRMIDPGDKDPLHDLIVKLLEQLTIVIFGREDDERTRD